MRICARHAARGGCKSRAAAEVARGARSCARRPKSRVDVRYPSATGVDAGRSGGAGTGDGGRCGCGAGASARVLRICARNEDLRAPCRAGRLQVARGDRSRARIWGGGPPVRWSELGACCCAASAPRRLGRLGAGPLAIDESVRVPERDRLVGTLVSPAPVSEGRVVVGAGQSDRSEGDSTGVGAAVVSRSRSGKLGDPPEGDSTGVGAAVVSRLERSYGRYADG